MAIAIAAAALGFYFGQPQVESPAVTDAAAQDAGQKLSRLVLSTPEGEAAGLSQWQGKVLVVNFWATWCPPCREEMPEFSRAHQKFVDKGVQFVGIGIDTPDNIINFKKTSPVSYPLLIGSYDTLKLTTELGNKSSALPFTVILDRNGRIAHTKMGKLDQAELEQLLAPLSAAAKQ
jgi:peroxiredoxin